MAPISVFILGPTYWRDDYDPQVPDWVEDHVPPSWDRYGEPTLEPVDVRAALCGWLDGVGVEATIMRMHEDRPD